MKALARPGVALPGGRATPGDRRFDLIDKVLGILIQWCALTAGWMLLLLILILSDSFRS